jgi:alkanesulfonate monooxygenase SsuD/methylene tetrahydromethanopterin reductase-like flavin-dependent oxidoreductase (luciferase family)
VFRPTDVVVARDVHIAKDKADKLAALERNVKSRQRILAVARDPSRPGGSHQLAYQHTPEATEAVALYGSPDEVMERIEALRAVGVHYVLASFGASSRESLRRFAREVAPAFADGETEAAASPR